MEENDIQIQCQTFIYTKSEESISSGMSELPKKGRRLIKFSYEWFFYSTFLYLISKEIFIFLGSNRCKEEYFMMNTLWGFLTFK